MTVSSWSAARFEFIEQNDEWGVARRYRTLETAVCYVGFRGFCPI